MHWCIVEQPHFVDCGKEYFEDDKLKFFRTVEDCLNNHSPDVLLLSGVLQYLEKPYDWIEKFVGLGIQYIIVDRTSFVEFDNDIITVQKVPDEIYPASYPAWFFNELNFLSHFKGYSIICNFESFCDPGIILNSVHRAKWTGYLFRIQ